MRSRAQGFTLIELIIVLGVIGILVALASGAGQRDRLAVNQAAQGLARDAQGVRFEAIRQNEFVGLHVSVDDNAYVLFTDDPTTGTRAYEGGEEFKTVDVAQEGVIVASASRDDMIFDPRGINPLAEGLAVTLVNRAGTYTQTVCVTAQGRTRVVSSTSCGE